VTKTKIIELGVQLASKGLPSQVVSNSTRWDTFEKLLPAEEMPNAERKWQQRYQKSSSFLHLGGKKYCPWVRVPPHLARRLGKNGGAEDYLCVIPTLLDPDLAPADYS